MRDPNLAAKVDKAIECDGQDSWMARCAEAMVAWEAATAQEQLRAEACLSWLNAFTDKYGADFEAFMRDFGEFPYKRWKPTHSFMFILDDDVLDAAIAEQGRRNKEKFGSTRESF